MNNREVKFRAWDKDKKVMLGTGINSVCVGKDRAVYIKYRPVFGGWEPEVPYIFTNKEMDNLVFLQFTGLLDKNGKEIYEGDIIKGNGDFDKPAIVEWNLGSFHGIGGYKHLGCSFFKDMKVIGNIYENPELLK